MKHVDDAIAAVSGIVLNILISGIATLLALGLLKSFALGIAGGIGGYVGKILIDKFIKSRKSKK